MPLLERVAASFLFLFLFGSLLALHDGTDALNMLLGSLDAVAWSSRPDTDGLIDIPAMKACMAAICGCDEDDISIKATTTEKLGFTGREEGISAYAVCLIEK